MIIQAFLNWLSELIAAMIRPIPALPPELGGMLAQMEEGIGQFAATAAVWGPIVPFGAIAGIVQVYLGLMVYWLAVLGVRFVAWALGR